MSNLYNSFCELIDQSRNWPSGRFVGNVLAPAFFFDELEWPADVQDRTEDEFIDPFPEYWLIIDAKKVRSHAGMPSPIINAKLLVYFVRTLDNGESDFCLYDYAPSGRWGIMDFGKQSKLAIDILEGTRAVAKLLIASREREEVKTNSLRALNAGRAKSKHNLRPVPNFIRLGAPLRVNTGHKGGTHASPIPHERMAHRRFNKRTGEYYPVKAAKVKGGSPVPKNYLVV